MFRLDGSFAVGARGSGRDHHLLMAVPLFLRKECDEGLVEVRRAGPLKQLRRRSGGQHAAAVHRDQPVESGGFLHVGGCNNDAHAGATARGSGQSVPRTDDATRGSTPVVGSSRIRRSGSWISAQQRPSFCFMPPESLPAGRAAKGASPVLSQKLADAALPLVPVMPEQAAEEVDVLEDGQRRIEVLAEALRHIGDARAGRPVDGGRRPCRRQAPRRVPAGLRARPRSSESRLDLPTPSGPISPTMQPAGMSRRDAVERAGLAVGQADSLQPCDRL